MKAHIVKIPTLRSNCKMLLTACLLFSVFCLDAQKKVVSDRHYRDSLKQLIFAAEDDKELVQLLNQLADSYWVSKYDSAIFYARNGLLIARKIRDKTAELNSLLTLSLVSIELGDMIKGYEYSAMAIKLAEELKNEGFKARAYAAHGKSLLLAGKYEEAIENTLHALTLPELKISQRLEYYVQLSEAYAMLGKVESADHFASQVLKVTEEIKQNDLSNAWRAIANMYWRTGDQKLAREFFLKAETSASEAEDYVSLHHTFHDLSRFYSNLPDSLRFYAIQMMESAEKSRNITLVTQATAYLAEIYRQINDDLAYEYAMKSNVAKDSLRFFIQNQSIRSFNDFDQKLRDLELQQARKEANDRLRQNTFIGGIIILSIIAFALYRNNLIKQRGKRRVEKAYLELKQTQDKLIQSEKMASLGELTAGIAHEIQNPLNFVNNFSDINKELIDEQMEEIASKNFEEVQLIASEIRSNSDKIVHHGKRAEAIVNSMLLHSRGSEGKKEPTDLNRLAEEYLKLAYHGQRAKGKQDPKVRFNTDFKTNFDASLPEIMLIPQEMGRVLLNLINNAFQAVAEKSAAEDGSYQPLVEVITRRINNQAQLIIKDNGAGIPETLREKVFQPFFTTKATGLGTGLGLSLSYEIITKRHDGSLDLKSEVGKGSEFRITLPIT